MLEYYVPVFFTSTKMKKLEDKFEDIINIDLKKYKDVMSDVINSSIKIGAEAEKIGKNSVKAIDDSVKAVPGQIS